MRLTHPSSEPLVVGEIVAQHAEEAAFLWTQRTAAVRAPHFRFQDFTHLDSRVEANIDGLRIAGEEGWQLCRKELTWEEPGEIFAAAVLALESGEGSKIDSVIKAA